MSFELASRAECSADGSYVWMPDARWNQGRGVYGGLTFATIVRTVEALTDQPIRRLSVELCAPVAAQPCEIKVQLKRQGRQTAFFASELSQGTTTVALAHITCGSNRASDLDHQRLNPRTLPSGASIPETSMMPDFAQFFEYWPDHGFPMSGVAKDAMRTGGWIAPRFDSPSVTALIVALIDAWWPAVFTATTSPRPMGTMSFAVDLVQTDVDMSSPSYLQIETDHVSDGYAIETDKLWSHDGRLLAQAQQNIAIIA